MVVQNGRSVPKMAKAKAHTRVFDNIGHKRDDVEEEKWRKNIPPSSDCTRF